MAIYKTANCKGKYFDESTKEDVISYVINDNKMIHNYAGGIQVNKYDIAGSMKQISAQFKKGNGVQIRHFIISFEPYELSNPLIVNEIAMHVILYLGKEYQVIYAVHENTESLHIHIVMNSVSYIDGHRYRGTRAEHYEFMSFLRKVLNHYGIHKLQYVSSK
ncbi:MAG: relaxase/mobilization nuclease domain-containing protein [Clostridia bacterium]|nr:relaxase/mobilization nuclease domain-containing protein [Clostridia bacterium]